MSSDYAAVIRVLRAQLTAVHQQFIHILALRQWGLEETASRILQIDRIDFPISMKIIDHMVASGQTLLLEPEPFTPGSNEVGVLAAELEVEQRLHAALRTAYLPTSPVLNLIVDALAPRQSYADWLSARIATFKDQPRAENDLARQLAEVFSYIIALIEQPMVHAFVHWHHGDKADADAAWATSGAAMMHATQIVRWLAARDVVPFARDFPSLRISGLPDKAIEFDRHLARSFEHRLTTLTLWNEEHLKSLCDPIQNLTKKLSDWEPGLDHPAKESNPPAFQSFETTLAKFVRV